jgi:hypothetical protein
MQNSNNNRKNQGENRSKRGLASASKETRARVASEGGRASGEARRENSNSGGGNSSNSGNSSGGGNR